MNSPLIVICGATATGKSGLALAIAQRLNAVIISADSRQIYREFDIGTAKPTLEEQQLVPHYLIDICDPTETLTLAEYQTLVNNSLPLSPSPHPLLVGGTGLYIKSIVKGLKIPRVSPQPELRLSLQTLGQPQCYAFLQQIDPFSAKKIHPNDTVRTLRALEVFYATGKPISEQQGESPPNYPILQIGLDCDVPALDARIKQRTDTMIAMGFIEEVERLGIKYGWDLPLLDTLGYAEIGQHLKGAITLTEARDLTVLHTRQFAKRQRTWFRAYPEIEWFNADSPDLLETVWQRIVSFLL
ncbi:tRNA (adenosine(37)-N6)-dimethylallyltransferase MiaA [Oscillatoria sp. FACHB-1406]|uniref:tRNA (adenosine(37)-N6)-dimethylallyltransferase MiaA n=1 Tax=Oscillatoria sp. FACHB-1406 TaxID=2692846 RepID=UPI0016874EA7|nr:tRNA (adenosine(37)-N6)-dimethylallyltransferase MiaA [Oscillatoria sp. FACHB-1406]MBD2579335.1 tRNA (adenosine(37)-N6)-dimethylallyltransferase MiaA [Oscillatoria sp. FACHB-1406]